MRNPEFKYFVYETPEQDHQEDDFVLYVVLNGMCRYAFTLTKLPHWRIDVYTTDSWRTAVVSNPNRVRRVSRCYVMTLLHKTITRVGYLPSLEIDG